MNEKEPLDTWGTLEAMGHQSHTGHITEERFGTVSMFRVDVPSLPATEHHDVTTPHTKIYGAQAIYALTPMEEETAIALLEQAAIRQSRYSRPTRLAIAAPDYDDVLQDELDDVDEREDFAHRNNRPNEDGDPFADGGSLLIDYDDPATMPRDVLRDRD